MRQCDQEPGLDQAAAYQIKVQGKLDESWSDWFSGMDIACENGITTLTGAVVDQVALRGILSKIWDLNLGLISVTPIPLGRIEMRLGQKGASSSE
jgi:hypothetical protein